MKVIHIIENIDESYGGPAKSVPFLCKYMQQKGVDVSINSVKIKEYENNVIINDNQITWNNYKNNFSDFFKYSISFRKGLENQIKEFSNIILHTQNQWTYQSYCALKLSKKYNIPLICSVRGSMSPWALSQYKYLKIMFWYMFQKRIFQKADCIHCTTAQEAQFIRDRGINTPIAVISNGVDLEEFNGVIDKQVARKGLNLDVEKKNILFLSRIHKSKGLDILIRAWSKLHERYPDWNIIFAGPIEDSNYYEGIKTLITRYNLKSVKYLGILKGRERIFAYNASSLFVSPTWSENFGISIAEAMASGIPVITTKNAPWEILEKESCGWWINLHEEKLLKALEEALSCDDLLLEKMGDKCRNIIYKDYSWEQQAEKMIEVYKWLLGEVVKPSFVYTS